MTTTQARLSVFATHNATQAQRFITPMELAQMVQQPRIGTKATAPLITPYHAPSKTADAARAAMYAAVVIDHDNDNKTEAEIRTLYGAKGLNVRYLAFTTSSHTEAAQRWKVVVPFAYAVEADTAVQLSAGIAYSLASDPAQARKQQGFYAPNKESAASPYLFITDQLGEPGEWLHPDDAESRFIQEAAQGWQEYQGALERITAAAKPKPRPSSQSASPGIVGQILAAHDLAELLERHGYRHKGRDLYLSPHSSSGTAGVKVLERDGKQVVYSHHGPACPLSAENHGGHALDVADVLCALQYGGDFVAMIKEEARLDPEGQRQRQREYKRQQAEASGDDGVTFASNIDWDAMPGAELEQVEGAAPAVPTPKPLLPDTAPPTPYPVDALPAVMREAVKAIAQHEQVPEAIAGQCAIGAATHLAQTRANAWHPGGKPEGSPCSLFMLSLFGSGEGKSSARRLAFKTIDEAEREARNQRRSECEQIHEQAQQLKGKKRDEFLAENPLPADPQTQYTDATFEPIAGDFIRGMAAASWDTDEGGQMLGGSSLKADTVAATLGGLTKAFDAGHFERTRSRGNVEGSGVAYNRRLSVHLLAQPVAVAEALSDPLLTGQGFLARFLFAAPDSLAGTRVYTMESLNNKAYADPRLQRYWARCKEIAATPECIDRETGEVKAPVLDLDDEAQQVWVDFKNQIERGLGPLGAFAGLKPFANRGAEQALRVATVMACFVGRGTISGDCMYNACRLVQYSLEEWLRYTDPSASNPLLKQAAMVMEWMREPERAESWRVFDKAQAGKSWPPAIRSAKKRDAVLAVLVEHNHLLTSDGKQFRLNNHAESAESAESQ